MEGVGKQMEADLLRHDPVAPDEALGQAAAVRPEGRAALSLDLLPHLVHLADQLAEVQRELVQRLLRGGKLHHFPERPFQPGRLHSHVVQRLCGAGVGGRGKVHLQILPVLVHQAQRVQKCRFQLFLRKFRFSLPLPDHSADLLTDAPVSRCPAAARSAAASRSIFPS